MSRRLTVFSIMRELDVEYETIVEIAISANIRVIKTPNTEISPRHYKKIMATAGYKKAKSIQEA